MKQRRQKFLLLLFLLVTACVFGNVWKIKMQNKDTYHLLAGTALENTVTVIKGKKDGASVYIVAGIHGDETAGWKAAERLKREKLESGTVYVLSPANRYGAEHGQRLTEEERDLNRNFPGEPEGCDAQRTAAAIYQDIRDKQPELVLDLHEAVSETEQRDALGNSIICQSLEESGDLVLGVLTESEKGTFGDAPFTLYGSPPPGSINRVVTEELGIPVITVETRREEKLEGRIEKHLALTRFILEYLGIR